MNDLDERIRTAVRDILDAAPDVGDRPKDASDWRRADHRPVLMSAAILIVVVGVAATTLVVRTEDNGDPARDATSPIATTPPTTALLEIGEVKLTVEYLPDGMFLNHAQANPDTFVAPEQTSVPEFQNYVPVTRFYAVDHAAPESAPVIVVTYDVWGSSTISPHPGAEPIEVNGMSGEVWQFSPDAEQLVFGPLDGHPVFVDGYNVSREQLLQAAAAVQISADKQATIPAEALPPGATELAAGLTGKSPLLSPIEYSEGVTTFVNWSDDVNDRTMVMETAAETPGLIGASRLGYQSVSDIEVGGRHGFLATSPEGEAILLSDGDRVVFISSHGLSADELIAVAESLRPATPDEWEDMTATYDLPDLYQSSTDDGTDVTSVEPD